MATEFEIDIQHDDDTYTWQVSQAAFDELDRVEGELSRFKEVSDISRINNMKAGERERLGLHAFDFLELATQRHESTGGAFDCTYGPRTDLAGSHRRTGMSLLELDPGDRAVTLKSSPIALDLGGIGKGYAVDRMKDLLNEWSIERALIHGGRSSVYAIGTPESTPGWTVSMSDPERPERIIATFPLRDRAMSASGLQNGKHIINPVTARPADSTIATWVAADTAAVSDGLSTAFMVMSPESVRQYCREHPGVSAMIMVKDNVDQENGHDVLFFGHWEK